MELENIKVNSVEHKNYIVHSLYVGNEGDMDYAGYIQENKEYDNPSDRFSTIRGVSTIRLGLRSKVIKYIKAGDVLK